MEIESILLKSLLKSDIIEEEVVSFNNRYPLRLPLKYKLIKNIPPSLYDNKFKIYDAGESIYKRMDI